MCFRAADGAAYQQTQDDVVALLEDDPDKPDVAVSRDDFGFTWLVVTARPDRRRGPVHRPPRRQHRARGAGLRRRAALLGGAVRRPRRAGGSGWSTSTSRAPSTRFAPTGPQTRDNLLEIQRPRRAQGRAADGAGPPALARPLGRPRPLTRRVGAQRHVEIAPSRRNEASRSRRVGAGRRLGEGVRRSVAVGAAGQVEHPLQGDLGVSARCRGRPGSG